MLLKKYEPKPTNNTMIMPDTAAPMIQPLTPPVALPMIEAQPISKKQVNVNGMITVGNIPVVKMIVTIEVIIATMKPIIRALVYNYGYIEWAISNFGSYSKYNVQQFSDMKKQELNVSRYGNQSCIDHVMRYIEITFRGGINPNFYNMEAWATKNPYAKTGLYGQCTWFAWGRFCELYGYDPGFTGNGWNCVDELLKAHPDKFERSTTPKAGAVFSGIGKTMLVLF